MNTLLEVRPRTARRTRLDLRDRLVVVTGGSAGIGHALAFQLAARGASIVVGSRRPTSARFEHRALDLASQSSVAEFADGLVRDGRPIDMLILNAGVHVPWKRLPTVDGQELHWQVNYLSSFYLAHRLLPLCRGSPLRRVLYVASEAHRLAALPGARLLGFWYYYARSKEAAITFFLRFQELHPELSVRVVSPGYVDSEIHRNKSRMLARLERATKRPLSPHAAAREMIACSERPDQNVYWDRGVPRSPSRRCQDRARAESLWRASLDALRTLLPGIRAPERISNYARNFQAFAPATERPATREELAAIVRRAAAEGKNVRAVGRRHSYNDSFHAYGCMVSLERLDRVLHLDPEAGTVTCEAGIPIGALCDFLDRRGYALRYSGNYGKQSLAGALATGTHGYGRDGGVMSELVRAVTLVRSDGSLVHTSDERDLRALRLSLGALGVIVELTLAIERTGPCRYQVACLLREEFNDRLEELTRRNAYLRFVTHPFDERQVLYVTINRMPDGSPTEKPLYIGDRSVRAGRLLVPWLRMPHVRSVIGRALAVGRHSYTLQVPFSMRLFIGSGVVRSHPRLARVGQLALDRNDWLNMELAVPLERFAEFDRLFEEHRPHISRASRAQPYFTSRVVGARRNVLLAPNYGRDVVFCDVHADASEPWSVPFLRRLEAAAGRELSARPHWAKVFFAGHERLRSLYPAASFEEFVAAKRRFDPEGVFCNTYTRRVLGL